VLQQVKALIKPGETVLVVLDSNHTKAHVLDELRAYGELIQVGPMSSPPTASWRR
jgi:cephalosporin hydroxylase